MSDTKIPVLDLGPEIDLLWDELNAAFQNVLRSGQFIMGGAVPELEANVAAYLGVKHAVALNSGTDALTIGLRAIGIEPGDEVITTTFSFFASAESVSLIGAHPVFADIDPETFNLDPAAVEAAITPRTKAIIPVHLFGQAADLAPLRELADRHRLKLLEDMAQAFGGAYRGRKLGTWGEAAALSFFPSKNLGAYGDAGMLVTNNDAAAEMARKLRAHGSLKKYHNEILGYNSRMDTLQAAILSVKLPHVDEWNAARRAAAARYNGLLADVPGIVTPCERPDAHHVYHQYTVRVLNGKRDAVQKRMAEAGIATMVYYPVPLHRLPFYIERGEHYSQAEAAAAEVLSLPLWPQITPEIQARVASALRAAVG
jgi:dTDP-4-amino-4,6-dideoxygalactose transaminase